MLAQLAVVTLWITLLLTCKGWWADESLLNLSIWSINVFTYRFLLFIYCVFTIGFIIRPAPILALLICFIFLLQVIFNGILLQPYFFYLHLLLLLYGLDPDILLKNSSWMLVGLYLWAGLFKMNDVYFSYNEPFFLAIPFIEIVIACLLLLRPRPTTYIAMIMQLGIFFYVAAYEDNSEVLPWNVFIIVQLWMSESIKKVHFVISTIIAILFSVFFPFLSINEVYPKSLSWHLYTKENTLIYVDGQSSQIWFHTNYHLYHPSDHWYVDMLIDKACDTSATVHLEISHKIYPVDCSTGLPKNDFLIFPDKVETIR